MFSFCSFVKPSPRGSPGMAFLTSGQANWPARLSRAAVDGAMTRREILAIAGILFAVAAAAVIGGPRGNKRPQATSLGQDWECSPIPYADVCIKRVSPPKAPQTAFRFD